VKFKRSIGPLGFLFCIIGAVIGSGWLLGPFYVAKVAGPAAVISWAIGGVMMAVILITYAELSTLLPMAGGPIRYLQFSHGTMASFTISWITWLATVATAPVETLAILHYASNYLPWLMYSENGVALLTASGYFIAAIILLLMTVINVCGARFLAKTNNLIVFLKLSVPVLTLIVLFSLNFHIANFHSGGFAPMGWKGILSALPTAGVVFSLMGCHAALQFSAEVKNPGRTIPLTIIGALIICTLLYILLQIAFVGALDPKDYSQGWSSLSFVGDMGPFVGLAMAIGAVWLTKILFIDAVISPYGCGLVYLGAAGRLGYAMSKNGYFPQAFVKLNKAAVPARVMALNYVIGVLLFLPFPTWQSMMSFLVSALILGYAVGPLALNVLRQSLKDHTRPFKVPCAYVVGFLGFYFSNLIVLWTGWDVVSKMMIAILIGYVVLGWYKFKTPKSVFSLHFLPGIWTIPYLIGLALCSYLSSFGGTGSLRFGWDFLAVGVLSLIIYVYAQKVGLNTEECRSLVAMEMQEAI
jgi:amino acid transporter